MSEPPAKERRWFVVSERHGIPYPALYYGDPPRIRHGNLKFAVELVGPWHKATLARLWAEYQQRQARQRWTGSKPTATP